MSELINNSEHRKKVLKELIKSLHAGRTVDDVKDEFQKYFGNVTTQEITEIEQALVLEGLPVEEIQRLCDVHASVFEGSIENIHGPKDYSNIPGHPVNIFTLENLAIEKLINEEINPNLARFLAAKDSNSYLKLRIAMDRLEEIDRHYARKEYLFFPYLEKRGITTPPKVMWGVDDEIRADIKEVINMLNQVDINLDTLEQKVNGVTQRVLDMISKEKNILLPLLSENFRLYEWIKIDEGSPEIGYTLIKPTVSWKVESPEEIEEKKKKEDVAISGHVKFDAGHLAPNEINAIFNTLPLDITFVDDNDEVKYFSQGAERIFERPVTIIGRKVTMCHPPASVHVVEKIIRDLRSGKKNEESFWIRMKDKFVMIRYFAVRDKDGNYLGTLEFTQDIKPLTELQGEKRLMSD